MLNGAWAPARRTVYFTGSSGMWGRRSTHAIPTKGGTAVKLQRTLLGLASAAVLLAALVSTASARNYSTTNQSLRATFREFRFVLPGATTNCQLTIEGSFHHRTAAKVIGSLVGVLTRVTLGPCASGTATILQETLPWHALYSGFTGALPNITTLRANLPNAALRVREAGGIACLARSSVAEPVVGTFDRDTVTGALTTGEGNTRGEGIRTGAECLGVAGTFSTDRGPMTLPGAATRITITLI